MNELIPDYYRYIMKRKLDNSLAKEECSICLGLISKLPPDKSLGVASSDDSRQMVEQESHSTSHREEESAENDDPNPTDDNLIAEFRFMLTPCKHIYHIKCLSKWMENKLVCPLCKR